MQHLDHISSRAISLESFEQNDMSLRYLKLLEAWAPFAFEHFQEWPQRPNCGHFFGGVHYYGQETLLPSYLCALLASSSQLNEKRVGASRTELSSLAIKGLRYLCFTHDTGPEDCLRPKEGLGRMENANTKWGERGLGFFKESQCGRNLYLIVLMAKFLEQDLDEETRSMVANIALDYVQRFEDIAPKSGIYYDTQTEENAWTALGLISGALYLEEHEKSEAWLEHAYRWLFCVSVTPDDAQNLNPLSSLNDASSCAKSPSQMALRKTVTTLPDMMCENHGFVHPLYTGQAVSLGLGKPACLLKLFGRDLPEQMFWNRQRIYDKIKGLCDINGYPHAPQGMDWPYLNAVYHMYLEIHASASLYLRDSDASRMEGAALSRVEKMFESNGGRVLSDEVRQYCTGQQDPALMKEPKGMWGLMTSYLFHLQEGPVVEAKSSTPRSKCSTEVYPHSGFAIHCHSKGINSISWRNRSTALVSPKEGILAGGQCSDGLLSHVEVQGLHSNSSTTGLEINADVDRLSLVMKREMSAECIESRVLFASLPDGACLIHERLKAKRACRLKAIAFGKIEVMNESFSALPECRGERVVHDENQSRVFKSYVSPKADADIRCDLGEVSWVNIDNLWGVVMKGGCARYENRHVFEPWKAVSDHFYVHHWKGDRDCVEGEEIGVFTTGCFPNQSHEDTSRAQLVNSEKSEEAAGFLLDEHLIWANFCEEKVVAKLHVRSAEKEFSIFNGSQVISEADATYQKPLSALGSHIFKPLAKASVSGDSPAKLNVDVVDSGIAYVQNLSAVDAVLVLRELGGAVSRVEIPSNEIRSLALPRD